MNDITEKSGAVIAEVLEPRHLNEVLALQAAVRAALPPGQEMFVLPQPDSYFQGLLERRGGLMVGLRKQGKLAAQIVLMGPITLEEAIDKNAITRSDVTFHHARPSESVIVTKSMAVHPDWQGNGLSQQLLQAALSQPAARLADHIFAQISAENIRSWELFMRNGFGIAAAALDPKDNQPRFVLQKPALGFALHSMASADDIDPAKDFVSIMRLTQREALVGKLEGLQAEAGLIFYARSEAAVSWYDRTSTGNGA